MKIHLTFLYLFSLNLSCSSIVNDPVERLRAILNEKWNPATVLLSSKDKSLPSPSVSSSIPVSTLPITSLVTTKSQPQHQSEKPPIPTLPRPKILTSRTGSKQPTDTSSTLTNKSKNSINTSSLVTDAHSSSLKKDESSSKLENLTKGRPSMKTKRKLPTKSKFQNKEEFEKTKLNKSSSSLPPSPQIIYEEDESSNTTTESNKSKVPNSNTGIGSKNSSPSPIAIELSKKFSKTSETSTSGTGNSKSIVSSVKLNSCKIEEFKDCGKINSSNKNSPIRLSNKEVNQYYIAQESEKRFYYDKNGKESSNQSDRSKLVTNVNILEQLKGHSSIVKFHCLSESNQSIYQIYEHGNGMIVNSLESIRSKLAENDIKVFALELINVLKYLQEKKIAWKSMRPENILVNEDDNIKIMNFEIAEEFKDENSTSSSLMPINEYSSPEFVKTSLKLESSKTFNLKAFDWYSLGCIIYKLFFGKSPVNVDPTTGKNEDKWKKVQLQLKNVSDCLSKKDEFDANGKKKIIIGSCPQSRISENAKNFILGLLNENFNERLKFAENIISHPWFSEDQVLSHKKFFTEPKIDCKEFSNPKSDEHFTKFLDNLNKKE